MPLDTLANVKLALGVTGSSDDAALTQLLSAADAFVESHTGRAFAGGTFTEYFPGGSRTLALRNYPVAAVTSVKVDPLGAFGSDTLRDPAGYTLTAATGVLVNRDGPFLARAAPDDSPQAVQVIYTVSAAAPADLLRAYAELVGHWFRQAKTHAAVGQVDVLQQTDGTTVTQYPWGVSGGFGVPAGVVELLARHRVPPV